MQKSALASVGLFLTACGGLAATSNNAADASQGSARIKQTTMPESDAINDARAVASWDEGGMPGCFDPSLSGRERAVAERLGGVPCSETSKGAAALAGGGDNWSGLYRGGGAEGASGELNIRRADATRYHVALGIGAPGCGGQIDGIGHASANRMTMSVDVPDGGRQCRLVMDRQGSTLHLSQSADCNYFHGAQCSFDGSYTR